MYALTGKPALIGLHDFLTASNDAQIGVIEKAELKEPNENIHLYYYGHTNKERAEFDLNDFINFVKSEKNSPESIAARSARFQKNFVPHGGTAGQRIFEYSKSQILKQQESIR